MKWKKAPDALVARFRQLAPSEPGVEQRSMFGYPSCFANGNMFAGLFQDRMVLRLGETDRAVFLALPDASQFEPMKGRPMREYVVVPPDLVDDDGGIRPWLARSLAYAASLPKKVAKAKRAKAAAKPRAAARKQPARAKKKRRR